MAVCSRPGCSNLTTRGKCASCKSKARKRSDAKRPNPGARGYDSKWERTRADYLAYFGTCEVPGCNEPATDVHHLDGLGPNGPLGHTFTNLQALCHRCHSRITGSEHGFH